jgi:dipeptidyl aminopeptidase/acylaminoacyl peptidase
VNARDRKLFDIVRINVASGESQPIFQNPGFTNIYTGIDFQVHLGRRFLRDGSAKVQKWEPDGTWSDLVDIGPEDALSTWPDAISANRKSAFFIDSRDRDTAALVEIDMATGERQVLAEDPEADISLVLYEPGSVRPYAAASVAARQRWHLIGLAYGFDLDHWRIGQPESDFSVSSQSNEGARIVLDYFRPDASDGFWSYERQTRKLTPLFKSQPDLDQVSLRPMDPVVIPASDGVPLSGYLTLPKDNAKNVPFVLAIHGGPYYRDSWGYNETHQFLASRGYGVLSVNYRGSTGFGKRFINLADKGWGGRMQDDLTDAAGWAIAQGYANSKRVGFVGASYGGYAGLMAATKTPDTFACVIDLFGESNLVTMMRSFPPYWTWLSTWKRRLADPETEDGRAWLTEHSPLTHADKIVRPLLIGQGMRDVRVTPKESEQIVQVMQQRQLPVTYVTFSDEGHGFVRQENRIAFSAVSEAFLAKHLGGQAEPIGDALAGSTIKFEVGRELIPGLG